MLLRRESNRIVDVEWMTGNAAYVREILRISRTTGNAELHARRVEMLHPELQRKIRFYSALTSRLKKCLIRCLIPYSVVNQREKT